MLDDTEGSSLVSEDDALGGDLELDPQDAEQVTGGARVFCYYCQHSHSQTDPKCKPACWHGSAGFGGGAGY